MNLLNNIGSRIIISCASMSVVFWRRRGIFHILRHFPSEFKPENGQLVQNKADTKAYVGVFSILFSVRFVLKLALYLCCTWVVFPWHKEYLYGGRQAYTGGFPSCPHNFKVELWSVGTLLVASPQLLHPLVSNIIMVMVMMRIKIHQKSAKKLSYVNDC